MLKVTLIDQVMEAVNTLYFIRGRGLNHYQLDNLLKDEGISHGLPYLTEVRLLSRVLY